MSRRDGVLIYDSAKAGALSGARSALITDRTLLFQAGDLSVDFLIHGGTGRLRLLQGQVVETESGRPVSGALIRLSDECPEVRTDELGQFAVSALSTDSDQVIHVETFDGNHFCHIPDSEAEWDRP